MGIWYTVTCRNKECGYRANLREGPGKSLAVWVNNLREEILDGTEDATEDMKELLVNGRRLRCVTNFLCTTCMEWLTKEDPFILEVTHASPYGTIREYKMHYLYGQPKCDKCGTELIHILNPRSSKNICPKCGSDYMRVGRTGYYD